MIYIPQVLPDTLLQAGERLVVPGPAQCRDIRLGKTLVRGRQVCREVHVLQPAPGVPVRQQPGNIVKTPAVAGADVENAAYFPVLHEPQVYVHHVSDINKIPALLAVCVAAAALEQFHRARLQQLLVQLENHAGHGALVPFPRAVNIEIAEADHLRARLPRYPAHVTVEQQFGVAVHVDRAFILRLLGETPVVAVHRGAGSIDQGHVGAQALIQQAPGPGVVVLQHESAILLAGVGTGALVKHLFRPVKPRGQVSHELLLVQVIQEVALEQVAELAAVAEVVHCDDVLAALRVQSAQQVAADKPGGAGDDDHAGSPFVFLILSTSALVEQSGNSGKVVTSPPCCFTCAAPAISSGV